MCLCDVEGLRAMCNFKKRKRFNEEEDGPVTAESSYLKMKSRCAKMAAELEQVSLRLHLTEQQKKDVDAHLEQALKKNLHLNWS